MSPVMTSLSAVMSTLVASGIDWVGPGTMDAAPEPLPREDAADAGGAAVCGVVNGGEDADAMDGETAGTDVDGPSGTAGIMFNAGSTASAITIRSTRPTTAPMIIFLFPAIPLPGASGFAGGTGFGVSAITGFSAADKDETDEGDKGAAVFPAGGIYQDGFLGSAFCPIGSGSVVSAGPPDTEGFEGGMGGGGGTGVARGAAVA